MNTTSIPTPSPVEDFDPNKFLLTDDWKRTERANWEFHNACQDKLRDAQIAGRGYFLECSRAELEQRMLTASQEEDYISVANYAMMLHTKAKVEAERDKWHEFHQEKLELQERKAIDDFFDSL